MTPLLNAYYNTYAIVSEHSKKDAFDALVSFLLTTFFCCLGVYARNLAYGLLVHPKVIDLLRLHSKKVFKLNSTSLLSFLLISFVLIFNFYGFSNTYPLNRNLSNKNVTSRVNPCQVIDAPVEICQVKSFLKLFFF